MRYIFSYGITLIIVLAIAAWLTTGTFVQGGRGPGNGEETIVSLIEPEGGPITEAVGAAGLTAGEHDTPLHEIDPAQTIAERNTENAGGEGSLRSVRVKTFVAQPFPIEVDLRGRTEARSSVSAAAETSGIVDDVHVAKGDKVEVGDLLCTIDRGTREARVTQAQASLTQAQAALVQAQENLANNAELRSRGVTPENTARQFEVALAAAEAGVSGAQSALDEANAELERTEVHARVAGVITEPLADAGAMLGAGAPCATIVQLDPIVFVGAVPEARIGLARLGLPVEIRTVAGDELTGEVSYISPVADAGTRSFEVEVSADNKNGAVRDGLTASARVQVGTVPAHLLPQSVLTLDNAGTLGIRSVKEGMVEFHAITIISDTRDGVWVTGLPLSVDVITLGQENVQEGQMVAAGHAEDESEAEGASS